MSVQSGPSNSDSSDLTQWLKELLSALIFVPFPCPLILEDTQKICLLGPHCGGCGRDSHLSLACQGCLCCVSVMISWVCWDDSRDLGGPVTLGSLSFPPCSMSWAGHSFAPLHSLLSPTCLGQSRPSGNLRCRTESMGEVFFIYKSPELGVLSLVALQVALCES